MPTANRGTAPCKNQPTRTVPTAIQQQPRGEKARQPSREQPTANHQPGESPRAGTSSHTPGSANHQQEPGATPAANNRQQTQPENRNTPARCNPTTPHRNRAKPATANRNQGATNHTRAPAPRQHREGVRQPPPARPAPESSSQAIQPEPGSTHPPIEHTRKHRAVRGTNRPTSHRQSARPNRNNQPTPNREQEHTRTCNPPAPGISPPANIEPHAGSQPPAR